MVTILNIQQPLQALFLRCVDVANSRAIWCDAIPQCFQCCYCVFFVKQEKTFACLASYTMDTLLCYSWCPSFPPDHVFSPFHKTQILFFLFALAVYNLWLNFGAHYIQSYKQFVHCFWDVRMNRILLCCQSIGQLSQLLPRKRKHWNVTPTSDVLAFFRARDANLHINVEFFIKKTTMKRIIIRKCGQRGKSGEASKCLA